MREMGELEELGGELLGALQRDVVHGVLKPTYAGSWLQGLRSLDVGFFAGAPLRGIAGLSRRKN